MTTSVRFCLSYDRLNWILSFLKWTLFQQKTQRCHGRRYDVICMRQMLCNVWSYDFYKQSFGFEHYLTSVPAKLRR